MARRLKARGITKLFTLSGGHIFLDLRRLPGAEGVDLDRRGRRARRRRYAAEGWAEVTREPGVCALSQRGPALQPTR